MNSLFLLTEVKLKNIMDIFKTFRQYLLVESKKDVPLSKQTEKVMTEQEIPEFTNFEKEILKIGIRNIDNLKVGTHPYEAGDAIYNTDSIDYHSEGIDLLNKYWGIAGTGWTGALEYLFEEGENRGFEPEFMSEKIAEGDWASVGNLLVFCLGEDLTRRSEVIERAIRSNQEELTSEDIEDLEDELNLFISN